MVLVDDQVALAHGRSFRDDAGGLSPLARARKAVAQNVLLGNKRELLGFETVLDRQHRQRVRAARQRRGVTPRLASHHGFDAVIAQNAGETFGRTI
jgi:hypothetical protein